MSRSGRKNPFDNRAGRNYKKVMARRWILLAVLAIAVAVAALIGFGHSSTTDPVAAAATKTQAAGGAKLAMTVDASAMGKSFSISANGSFDQDEADLTMDLSSVLQGSGLPLPAGAGTIELRYLQESGDPVLYLNAPFLATELGGKSWVRLDVATAGKSLGLNLDQLTGGAGQSPADVLGLLKSVGSVQTVGTETVDGVSTTHYKASIDLQKAAALKGQQEQDFASHLIAQGAPAQVPLDVWIGDDGLVHKLTLDEQLTSGTVDLTLDLSDYGTDVNVTAPPSDQVFDVTALASQLKGLSKA